MVGYFEEQAVVSYTFHSKAIDVGKIENTDAPRYSKKLLWIKSRC